VTNQQTINCGKSRKKESTRNVL